MDAYSSSSNFYSRFLFSLEFDNTIHRIKQKMNISIYITFCLYHITRIVLVLSKSAKTGTNYNKHPTVGGVTGASLDTYDFLEAFQTSVNWQTMADSLF